MASYDSHAPHMAKRQRTDDSSGDPHNPAPSKVIHVRGLSEATVEDDVHQAVQRFGPIGFIMMMPRRKQALIEFEELSGAQNCVEYAQSNKVLVGYYPAFFNYSTSQKIQRPGGGGSDGGVNHILLFTILNPQYHVTVDVMQTICAPYGQVLRIVIFKKSVLQSMVEFDSIDSAKRAKQALNGADVYSGCCTLKIEFAKTSKLNVNKNDSDSWDYTNAMFDGDMSPRNKRQALLSNPRGGGGGGGAYGGGGGGGGSSYDSSRGAMGYGSGGNAYGGGAGSFNYKEQDYYGSGGGGMRNQQQQYGMQDRYQQQDRYGGGGGANYYGDQQGGGGGAQHGTVVLMVYSLHPEKMNCERLFNLFCLYGNVVKIKFLKTKEGTAMIQMGDPVQAENALENLNGAGFFDSKTRMAFSNQVFIQDVMNPYELPDGSESFKCFMGNRNNRFQNPDLARKNRIQAPCKVLHYFNAPPMISEEDLAQVFEGVGAPTFQKLKQISKSEKSSSGLIEFENKSDAIEALIVANHIQIPNQSPGGSRPYTLKLCFSASPLVKDY